ncbi:hypothetical protein [Bradyrhizobium stylosanthis]|uniref:Uncharacterized protein n=1 Tax=Bradyrhizobium stylosanthis TaxID=1803665 RepID=A0A560CX30_9BRAD|nr:hypothetical protein [Bradyrhizobium stylosanthis]TWA89391.1 hypothetical protein FBZ96_1205 [Bradyrhizobium stylosanthis]
MLADDSKPIRLARQAGLPYTRPLPEWRRQEGPDERDIEIVELKREIGAHPILTLSLADVGEQNRLLIEDNPKAAEDACRKAFAEAAVESEPQTSREALIKRYGLYSPGPYDLAVHLRGVSGLEESQLQGYENDYRRFVNKSQEIAKTLHVMLSAFGFTRHIDISAGNAGDRLQKKFLLRRRSKVPSDSNQQT